jgi:hypothetical protein
LSTVIDSLTAPCIACTPRWTTALPPSVAE